MPANKPAPLKTTLGPTVAKSLVTYAEALIEAFNQAKVTDFIEALTETDCYPRLMKIPNVEWMIGWLHGLAEAHEVSVKIIWAEALRMIEASRGAARRRGKAA